MSRDNRRERVLAEAITIIAQRGYHGFGLQELADRCGMTKPGLLHHFGSKENLLIEVLRERDRKDQVIVTAALDTGPDARPQVRTLDDVKMLLRAIVSRNRDQPELVRLFTMLRAEALNPGHPAHGYFQRREADAVAHFADWLEAHVDDARLVARELVAVMGGLELQWLRDAEAFDLLAAWDHAAGRLICPGANRG